MFCPMVPKNYELQLSVLHLTTWTGTEESVRASLEEDRPKMTHLVPWNPAVNINQLIKKRAWSISLQATQSKQRQLTR